jgi:hypothetical protein
VQVSTEPLKEFVDRIARERNVDPLLIRAVITDLFRELHERIYKDGSYGHALPEILFQFGEEAVYHFGGILIESVGNDGGDFGAMVNESIARLGYRLSRFRTTMDKWEMEKQWDAEDRLADRRDVESA